MPKSASCGRWMIVSLQMRVGSFDVIHSPFVLEHLIAQMAAFWVQFQFAFRPLFCFDLCRPTGLESESKS